MRSQTALAGLTKVLVPSAQVGLQFKPDRLFWPLQVPEYLYVSAIHIYINKMNIFAVCIFLCHMHICVYSVALRL